MTWATWALMEFSFAVVQDDGLKKKCGGLRVELYGKSSFNRWLASIVVVIEWQTREQ